MAHPVSFPRLKLATTVPYDPEMTSFLDLHSSQQRKVYFSGPLDRNIVRDSEGNIHPSNGRWVSVWVQIVGHTLCVEAVEIARVKGTDVLPSYTNIAESKLGVYGSVTSPRSMYSTTQHNVISLNGAVGMDLTLFACPSPASLISWIAAFRLASWEHGRFQELYTGHLFKILTNSFAIDIPRTNYVEGWCSLLLMDQRKWRKVWVVISSRSPQQQPLTIRARKRFSLLTALQNFAAPVMHDGPYIQISSTNSERHVRNPIVLVKSVTQATAVYPDKRELIPTSSILRVEGRFSSGPDVTEADEREGACLLMPDSRQGITESENLIKWLTAVHDIFGLYGRPQGWSWDPRNQKSLFFAYPLSKDGDTFFLDRESLEGVDPRYSERSHVANSISQLIEKKINAPPSLSTAAQHWSSTSETEAESPAVIDPRSLLDGSDNSQAASGPVNTSFHCFCRPRGVSLSC